MTGCGTGENNSAGTSIAGRTSVCEQADRAQKSKSFRTDRRICTLRSVDCILYGSLFRRLLCCAGAVGRNRLYGGMGKSSIGNGVISADLGRLQVAGQHIVAPVKTTGSEGQRDDHGYGGLEHHGLMSGISTVLSAKACVQSLRNWIFPSVT